MFTGNPDKDWWDKIIYYEGSGGSGKPFYYCGWLSELVEDKRRVDRFYLSSGLLSVPLEIQSPGGVVRDTAALVAGMLGYTVHEGEVPVVQPFQGWSLMLPEKSPLRSKTAA